MENNNFKFFKPFYNQSAGCWYFATQEGTFKSGKPSQGIGAIKYDEGSIYQGEVYYDGANFHKLGFGVQDFIYSQVGSFLLMPYPKIHKFVGQFDYRVNNWIYGNGVEYFINEKMEPLFFLKGFFNCLEKIGPYQGEFDYSQLPAGYTKDMEIEEFNAPTIYYTKTREKYENIKELQTFLVGDSYLEFWFYETFAGENNTFKDHYDVNKHFNAGIGGSKFDDWFKYIKLFKNIKEPQRIFINLGFNDINCGYSPEKVANNLNTFMKTIKEYYPHSKVYLFEVCKSAPLCLLKKEEHEAYAKYVKENEERLGYTLINVNQAFVDSGKDCYFTDGVHPNKDGYDIFAKLFNEIISK